MSRNHVIAAIALVALGASPVIAQTKWTEIKRADSLIRLQLPGLKESREAYAWVSDAQYIGITYAASQAALRADYPRGESSLVKAFATASVQTVHTIDAARLKEMFAFFKDSNPVVERAPMAGSTREHQVRRFTVDGANCVAFEIFPSGVDQMQLGGGTGTAAVSGYYCGPPRVPLTDTDVQWVLWGHEVALPPSNAYVRLAPEPATPPSAALSGAPAVVPLVTAPPPNSPTTKGPVAKAPPAQAPIAKPPVVVVPPPKGPVVAGPAVKGPAVVAAVPPPRAAVTRTPAAEAKAAFERKDFATAAKLWRPLAEQGDPTAQYSLGQLYLTGRGVTKDPAEALSWLRKSAEQGDATAQLTLAQLYRAGEVMPADYAAALTWYRRAATQRQPAAYHGIGNMYQEGEGVPRNLGEAKKWLELAIALYPDSEAAAKKRATQERDQVVARMTFGAQ